MSTRDVCNGVDDYDDNDDCYDDVYETDDERYVLDAIMDYLSEHTVIELLELIIKADECSAVEENTQIYAQRRVPYQ